MDAEDPCLLLQDNDANLSQTVLSACSLLQSLKVESMPIPVRPDNSDQTFTIQISRQVHAQVAFNMTESLSSLFQHLLKITCVPIDTQAHVYIFTQNEFSWFEALAGLLSFVLNRISAPTQ